MKKINSKDKNKKSPKLRVLAASTLGLSMLLSAPQMPSLLELMGQYNVRNTSVMDNYTVTGASKLNSVKYGATTTVVDGANNGTIGVNTGVTNGYTGTSGLSNAAALQDKADITGNWVTDNDDFYKLNASSQRVLKTAAELLELSVEQGNIFKKDNATDTNVYIGSALEFSFFSAFVKAAPTHQNLKNVTFHLEANIDLAGKEWKPVCDNNENQTSFDTNFDGHDYTISNVYVYDKINDDKNNYYTHASIFGNWGGGYIKNLKVENAHIQSWRGASVIADKRTDLALASDFENITIKNSKVVAGTYNNGGNWATTYATGVSNNALEMVDCYMENCIITATDTDADLIGEDAVKNVANYYIQQYIIGLGRARSVTKKSAEKVGIVNTKVCYDAEKADYNPLNTRGRTKDLYVMGVAYWNDDAEESEYSDITVQNCDVYANTIVKDAATAVTLENNESHPFYHNENAYVYGVLKFSRNSTIAEVNIENVNVTDSKVYSNFKYQPDDETLNKDTYFSSTNYAYGVGDVYTNNPVPSTVVYNNVNVTNCEVSATGEKDVLAPQTYLREANNTYVQVSTYTRAAGMANVSTPAVAAATKFVNCKVESTDVTTNALFNNVDNTEYYGVASAMTYGLADSTSGYSAEFENSVVNNCNLSAVADVKNGAFTGELDYCNPLSVNALVVGIGKGNFTSTDNTLAKGTKVTNTKMFANANDNKDTTVDKIGSTSGSASIVGLGYVKNQDHGYINYATVDNCDMKARAYNRPVYIAGMTRHDNNNSHGYTQKNCKLSNTTIDAFSDGNEVLVAGLSYNPVSHDKEEAKITISKNTVENVKAELESVRGQTYAAGGLYNSSTVYNGVVFNENQINELSINSDRENGYSYYSLGLQNSGSSYGEVVGNTIKNSYVSAKTTESSRDSTSYIVGLALVRATRYADDVWNISDNTVDNSEIYATTLGKGNSNSLAYTSGMVFNNCSAIIQLENNTVKNTNVKSNSNVGTTRASAMLLQNSDRKSTVDKCYAYNNIVEAIYEGNGSGQTREALASGLAGYYVAKVTNSVVGTGRVYAKSDLEDAGAFGIAAGRGFCDGYTARADNVAENVWKTEITGCYNFAEITAETGSQSYIGYAAGIGRAEIIDSCANYGNVTGNYAGGITTGYTMTGSNDTNTQHSLGLSVTNCMNAGNVTRANGGAQSFIGGIVARYEMRYYALHQLVLENNISVGGVYSGYNSTTGKYSQQVSSATYLGMLYGYISIPTAICDRNMETVSIRNNYMLTESTDNGKNNGLYYSNDITAETVGLKGNQNSPSIYYMATTEGVFYSTNSSASNVERLQKLYTYSMGIGDTAYTNKIISSSYDTTTFALNENFATYTNYANWNAWSADNGDLPQLATSNLDVLVVRYDIGNNAGVTPVVQIVRKDESEYTLSDGCIDGTSTSIIDQVGVSLTTWQNVAANQAVDTGATVSPYTTGATPTFINGVITYRANVSYTEYTVNMVTYDPLGTNETALALTDQQGISVITYLNKGQDKFYTATYNGSGQFKGAEIQILKRDVNLDSAQESDWVTLQIVGATSGTSVEWNIGSYITEDMLTNYATRSDIYLRAKPVANELFAFTKAEDTSEGAGHYNLTATYDGIDAFTNKAPKDSDVLVSVNVENFYTLKSVTVGGVDKSDLIANNSFSWTVADVAAATDIEVEVEKTKYNFDISFINLQGVTLDSNLVNTLIENAATTMSVDSSLPAIKAKTDVSGYRFVGWKLMGMDGYLPATDGVIDANYMVQEADFARYLVERNAETKFNLVAVYQRQYSLDVRLNNQFGPAFASEYEVEYVDENGVTQVLNNVEVVREQVFDDNGQPVLDDNDQEVFTETIKLNETGSYMIDESTFVQLKVKPNKRVSVVTPDNEQFGNNVVYIYLVGNKEVNLDFAIRPITITSSVLNVDAPVNESGLPANQLSPAISYTVKDAEGTVIGSSQDSTKLNINNRVSFNFEKSILDSTSYRFVELRLLNVTTNEYDVVELDAAGELVVDDNFFDNYVNDEGQVATSMKVIKQYNAQVVGENLVSNDSFELGSYTISILDENGNPADPSRYTVKEANKSYLLDNGLQLVVNAVVENDYAEFAGFTGVFDTDTTTGNTATAKINDNRSISLRFEKSTYTIEAPYNATVGGSLEYTKSFQLGDTISISYTPKNNYQITDWKLLGKALSDLGAVQSGNTITIKVTEEFLAAMNQLGAMNDDKLTIGSDIDTMMSPTLFYGIIGGGAAIVLLFGTIVFLVLRSSKLKKQKEENERKLNDIKRKFNIADTIKDLKNM